MDGSQITSAENYAELVRTLRPSFGSQAQLKLADGSVIDVDDVSEAAYPFVRVRSSHEASLLVSVLHIICVTRRVMTEHLSWSEFFKRSGNIYDDVD